MAEIWESLKSVRLKLRDPSGFISLQTIATPLLLPVTPVAQTAYRVESLGEYQTKGLLSWERVTLRMSDDMLNSLIEMYGENGAISRAISQIMASLYEEVRMVRHDSGSESMQFQTLTDILSFYRALRDVYKEDAASEQKTSTGRIMRQIKPVIGGVRECLY